jgi:hypothetical protein
MRERPNLIVRPKGKLEWLEKPVEEPEVEEPKVEELPKELAEELQKELDDIKTPPAKYRIELRISDQDGKRDPHLEQTLQRHIDFELNKFFSASSDIVIDFPDGESILIKNTEAIVSSDNNGHRTAEYKPKKENISRHASAWKGSINISSPTGPSSFYQQEFLQNSENMKTTLKEYDSWMKENVIKTGLLDPASWDKKEKK